MDLLEKHCVPMSYSRFLVSDVYVFHASGGQCICQICKLMPTFIVENGPVKGATFHEDFTTKSRKAMIDHLNAHLKNGDTVDGLAIPRLMEEINTVGDAFD